MIASEETLHPAPDGSGEDRIPLMTRVMRLPTSSIREARSIVRLQLDRLSPLPASETVFDVVPLQAEQAQGVYAVGILRRALLSSPPYDTRAVLTLTRDVEGRSVTFRFRNAGATSEAEARYLKHAPHALMIALGIAAVCLSIQVKAADWRDQQLPAIASEARALNVAQRDNRNQTEARAEWMALERRDAATRILCLDARLGEPERPAVIRHLRADADRLTVVTNTEAEQSRLQSVGGQPVSAGDPTAGLVFEDRECA